MKFPSFKQPFEPPQAISMDEYLRFVLFVNEECESPLALQAYKERKLPTVPFQLGSVKGQSSASKQSRRLR